MKRVHIFGAGISGLAAATRLAELGLEVSLYEAAPQAGGRCRSFFSDKLGQIINNGNHVLLGANQEAWRFLARIDAKKHWQPITSYQGVCRKTDRHWKLDLRKTPYWKDVITDPLLRPGLRDMFAFSKMLKAHSAVSLATTLPPMSSKLRQHILEPFMRAVLNSEPIESDARLGGYCLRQALLSGRRNAMAYLPSDTLDHCVIQPALHNLSSHKLHYNARLRGLGSDGKRITHMQVGDHSIPLTQEECVVLATPPWVTQKLVPFPLIVPEKHQSIINAHFVHKGLPSDLISPQIQAVSGGIAEWVTLHDTLISTTTSAANHLLAEPQEKLLKAIWADVCAALRLGDCPIPEKQLLIIEKRATFTASTENLHKRPVTSTALTNLFLAGDYTDTGLPATIDGAAMSGHRVAERILQRL